MAETNVFKDQDIANLELPVSTDSRFGSDSLRTVKEFQVGAGESVFRADSSGIWLGASTFANAPFRVSMTGQIIATGLVVGAGVGQGTAARVFSSTPTTPYSVGDIWVGGSSSDMKRCIVARSTGAYNASDWELATKYTDDGNVTTIVDGYVSTSWLNAKYITAGSVSANNVTAGTLTGSTIQTAGSGIRVVIAPVSIYSPNYGITVDGIAFRNGSSYYGGIYPYYGAGVTGIIIGDEADSYIDISPDTGIDLVGWQVLVNGTAIGSGGGSPWTNGQFTATLRIPVGTNMY